jgi:hypothetical protein
MARSKSAIDAARGLLENTCRIRRTPGKFAALSVFPYARCVKGNLKRSTKNQAAVSV